MSLLAVPSSGSMAAASFLEGPTRFESGSASSALLETTARGS